MTIAVAALREQFDRDGVVVLEGMVGGERLRTLQRAIIPYLRKPDQSAWADAFSRFDSDIITTEIPEAERGGLVQPFAQDPGVEAATHAVLPAGFDPFVNLIFVAFGDNGRLAWHQDSDVPLFLNRILYPEDIQHDQGALVYLPGSHRMGRIQPGGAHESMAGEVVLAPTAGTVVLMDSRVYHRVTPNRTERPRVSINVRVFRREVSRDVPIVGFFRNGSYDFSQQPDD
jgi:hypothetical protein